MSENNSFLSGYGKNSSENETNIQSAEAKPMKYEEKSSFKKPEKRMPPSSPSSGSRSKTMLWLIIAVVVVAAVATTLLLLFTGGTAMKNIVNWTLSDAQLWANENKVTLQIKEEFSDVYEQGRIISQSFGEGSKVKKGDFVEITVSKGHDLSITLPLPNLLSMTKDEVEAWASENFMTKVRITTEYSDDVPAGKVISFTINDNTVVDEVRRDTPVYVIVSKGIEDETAIEVTVPDFKTMAISDCFAWASENGIELKLEERFDNYVPKGTIISQSVKATAKVKKGDEIIIVVSKGKEIIVPDFSGYTKEKAASVAAEMGIPVSVKEKYSGSAAGRFLSQSIPAGTVFEDGDYLELWYSLGNKIVVSSFVGQPREAIENWAKELNEYDAKITIKTTYTQNSAPAGTIIAQDIANEVVGRGTTIRITVSKGRAVTVPDFVTDEGLPYGEIITRETALEMCEDAGIIPVFVKSDSPNRLPGEVWYQSIAAGTEVYEGTTITLKYKAPAQLTVPDFKGMTQQEVLDADYDMKLLIIFVESDDVVPGYEGKIFDQSVAKNTTVAYGSEIILYVSPV